MLVSDLLADYLVRRPNVSIRTAEQYQITCAVFSAYLGRQPAASDFTVPHVGGLMRWLLATGRTGRTANNKRQHLLTLWRFAWEHPDGALVPTPAPSVRQLSKATEIRREPRAWREAEMSRLLSAALAAPTRRGWSGAHWAALISVAYDTCRRIGALMAARREHVDWSARTLFIPGEREKGKADSWTDLSERSVELLRPLPEADLLFDWPFSHRQLYRLFRRQVLIPAGLPATRRDLFHRVRRTSYTFVARELGIAAASEHASHKSDLSRYYLDRSLLNQPRPLDVLPPLRVVAD